MPLQNPGAAFGTPGYGIQAAGGAPCNKLPSALIDKKLVSVDSGLHRRASQKLRFHSQLCLRGV